MPALSGAPGAPLTVLWSQTSGSVSTTHLAQSPDGHQFTRIEPPPTSSRTSVILPSAVTLPDRSLVLLDAELQPSGHVSFPIWLPGADGRWRQLQPLASGRADGYLEIGELLGVASAGYRVLLAAPTQQPTGSATTLAVLDVLPKTSSPGLGPSTRAAPHPTTSPGRIASIQPTATASWSRGGRWTAVLVLAVLPVWLAVTIARRRHRTR
jgi:hypothetical protein